MEPNKKETALDEKKLSNGVETPTPPQQMNPTEKPTTEKISESKDVIKNERSKE